MLEPGPLNVRRRRATERQSVREWESGTGQDKWQQQQQSAVTKKEKRLFERRIHPICLAAEIKWRFELGRNVRTEVCGSSSRN